MNKGVSRSISITAILDGESAPYYFTELFAWSNVESTQNNTTSPFGNNTEPNPAWKNYIPENTGGLAYLWCKQTKYTWNEQTRQYSAGTPQYYRRTGTNGTSINIKGAIDVIVASGDLPTEITGGPSGLKGVIQGSNKIYVSVNRYYDAVSWNEYATASDGDSYTIIRDNTLSINGEPAENKKGHLIQWLAEAGIWQDLGLFQGQSGKTYYTHVAWADDVTISGSTLPIPQGQTTRPNASSVTGGSIVQTGDKPWMGIMVDETAQDSTTYTNYTWSEVHANDPIVLDLTNEMDGIQYAGSQKVGSNASTQAVLLKGGVPVDVYDENDNPDGVQFRVATHSGIPENQTGEADAYELSASGSAATATVKKLSADRGELVIRAEYKDNYYYKTFSVAKIINKPKYELKLSKDIIAVNMSDSPSAQTDNVKVYKTVINSSGTTTTSLVTDLAAEGLKLWAQDGANQPTDKTQNYDNSGTGDYNHTVSLSLDSVTFYLTNNSATYETVLTNLIDRENVPVTKVENGAAGEAAWVSDIDNEMDSVQVDNQGLVPENPTTVGDLTYSAMVQTTAKLLRGSAAQGFTVKVYDENDNEYTNNANYNGNGIKVVYETGTQTSNTIKVYFNRKANVGDKRLFKIVLNNTYTEIFTVKGVVGDIYQLFPNINEVVFGLNSAGTELSPSQINLYCGYSNRTRGQQYAGNDRANLCKSTISYTEDGQTKYGTAPYNIFYRTQASNGTWGDWGWAKDLTNGTLTIARNTTLLAVQFALSNSDGASDSSMTEASMLDKETIKISKSGVKGQKGDDAWSFELTSPILSWNTDQNDVLIQTNAQASRLIVRKGATPQTVSSVSASGLPTGFTFVEGTNGVFTISPSTNPAPTLATPTEVTISGTVGQKTYSITLLLLPNKHGANGADAIHLDLNNQMDSILYSGSTKVGSNVTSQATLYRGGTPITSGVTFSKYSVSGIPNNSQGYSVGSSSGLITVKQLTAARGILVVKANYNNVDYYATFTVDKVVDKPKYEIHTDKDIVTFNTTNGGTQYGAVTMFIYKTTINADGTPVKSLVVDLDTDGLHLYNQYVNASGTPGEYINETDEYDRGFQTTIPSTQSSMIIYLCSQALNQAGPYESGLLDVETIPVITVQDGQKGDATRQPYEWGTWEAFIADNSNTFTANKYEAPYFIRTEEYTDQNGIKRTGERKWLWVGEDGTFNPTQVDAPSSSSSDWTLMVTDFKYLMSEAVIADYGKVGAGVFSKDYAFSQYGRVDGAGSDIDHYKNFRPEFFKGNAYEMFSGSKTIDSTNYPSSNQPYEFGTLYLESGIDYTFDFTFGSYVGSNIHFDLVRVSDGTKVAQWTGYGTASTASRPYPNQAGSAFPSGDYAIRAYATSGSIIFNRITVTASKAFRPNIYIDWLKGEIFSQLGHFINVTIEGVLNNLIQEINNDNYDQYGVVSPDTNGNIFWLNPSKVGSIIRYKKTMPLGLPSAFATDAAASDGTWLCDSATETHQMTLEELRQCVGKRLYVFTDDNSSMTSIKCGRKMISPTPDKMMLYDGNGWHYNYTIAVSLSDYFYIFECKMDILNNRERIYWEIERSGYKLPDTLAWPL